MQDPNADTEWNDVLRAKGILPPKEEIELTEDDIVAMVENTIQQKSNGKDMSEMGLDELDDIEDDIDEEEEKIFEQYRRQRMAEMREAQQKNKFGEVREISKSDWVTEVNKAGDGIWVVIHVYKPSMPLCKLVNQHISNLAQKFPATKFLRSVSSVCIPNYPDKNLPTIFVYCDNEMKKQFVGPLAFGGMNLKQDELEWMLSQSGAVKTDLEEPPRPEVKDVMNIAIRESAINRDDSDDDY
ncbi:phosducin-like protein 3 [Mercenaria mercenaria]|uniref:phosducin-like protein 3 n=1 Tax=Mercenaria mercenaria TaxID=6596 RepID=UPI00234EB2E6|nr:phosducin-like protein 3 [Mercenaria mercenaria]XP_053382186.1 phosducin-like protein 3 [Mercenaria mercenaria]